VAHSFEFLSKLSEIRPSIQDGSNVLDGRRRIKKGGTERLGAPKPARDALTAAQACRPTLHYLIDTKKEKGYDAEAGVSQVAARNRKGSRRACVFSYLARRPSRLMSIWTRVEPGEIN
jgi:hypothetical protein